MRETGGWRCDGSSTAQCSATSTPRSAANPIGKALRVLLVVGIPETIIVLGGGAQGWQLLLDVAVRLGLMTYFFLALALLWERHLARLAGVPWDRVRDLRRGRSLFASATTVLVAAATVVATTLTSAAISPIAPNTPPIGSLPAEIANVKMTRHSPEVAAFDPHGQLDQLDQRGAVGHRHHDRPVARFRRPTRPRARGQARWGRSPTGWAAAPRPPGKDLRLWTDTQVGPRQRQGCSGAHLIIWPIA